MEGWGGGLPDGYGPQEGTNQPAYVPAHRAPVWLSSDDVRRTIMALGDRPGVCKATLWDVLVAVGKMTGPST